MNAKDPKERAIELIRQSDNYVIVSEGMSVSIKQEGEKVSQMAIVVANHFGGMDEAQIHSFLISIREVEETLLKALRQGAGLYMTHEKIDNTEG